MEAPGADADNGMAVFQSSNDIDMVNIDIVLAADTRRGTIIPEWSQSSSFKVFSGLKSRTTWLFRKEWLGAFYRWMKALTCFWLDNRSGLDSGLD